MPDDTQMPAQTKRQEIANMRFDEALDYYTPQLADALPDHIPLNRFKRVVVTAVNTNPELARADRLSLFNSCVKCALDGLVPDGREAALVVYETSVKSINERGMDQWHKVDVVQYMPMVAGIRKRMRNSGEVLSADAEIVCRNDKFHYRQGDSASIEHEPPPLDQDRGEMVGAYSIIKLANGEVLREVMRASEIEHVMRTFAKGYDKPRSPWVRTKGEMWRKTVLRRNHKKAPSDSELDRLLGRDDEATDVPDARDLPAIPPRPVSISGTGYVHAPTIMINGEPPPGEGEAVDHPAQQTWTVTLPEGELWDYDSPDEAAAKLTEALEAAADAYAFAALWDDNTEMMRSLPDALTADLLRLNVKHMQRMKAPESPQASIPVSDRLGTNPDPIPPSAEARSIPRRSGPQASEAPLPPPTPPEPEKAPTASAEPRPIPVPNDPGGRRDYRAWALVLFMPAARKATSRTELDLWIGFNEEHLDRYKATLTPMYRKAFEDEIAALFAKLAP